MYKSYPMSYHMTLEWNNLDSSVLQIENELTIL